MPEIRPIIFSEPMVRRLIKRAKTQTRRLASSPLRHCSHGDRLYVRETFAEVAEGRLTVTRADYPACVPVGYENVPAASEIRWRPCIHMPRRLSRIWLEVSAVRVEPLHAISEDDCIAEGVEPLSGNGPNFYSVELPDRWSYSQPTAKPCYERLWQALHGDQSWNENPDVAVIEFTPHAGNVDA